MFDNLETVFMEQGDWNKQALFTFKNKGGNMVKT